MMVPTNWVDHDPRFSTENLAVEAPPTITVERQQVDSGILDQEFVLLLTAVLAVLMMRTRLQGDQPRGRVRLHASGKMSTKTIIQFVVGADIAQSRCLPGNLG